MHIIYIEEKKNNYFNTLINLFNHCLYNILKLRMAVKKKSDKRIKKENYWKRLQLVANKYNNVLFIDVNNVSSNQISKLRVRLREIDAYMIMGKNVSLFYITIYSFIFKGGGLLYF
jgi:hypothetical protein